MQAKILVKIEYFNSAGSLKDRVAKVILDDAENIGIGLASAVLSTGIGGSHKIQGIGAGYRR